MTKAMTSPTPTTNVTLDTSTAEPTNTADTSTQEPTNANAMADDNVDDVENHQDGDGLLAGKFKTSEELAKAYKELEPIVGQAGQYKKRIEELENQLKSQEQTKEKQAKELQEKQLQQAKAQGFNSHEELEISNKCKIAEFEFLVKNLPQVNENYFDETRQALIRYYQTGDHRHLNEAKKYFNSDVLEQCSIEKNDLKNQLMNELHAKKQAEFMAQQDEFVNSLENNEVNKEFLQDIATNSAKLDTLKVFFHQGLIRTQADFDVFKVLYNAVEEQAINSFKSKQQADSTLANEQSKASFNNNGTSQGQNFGDNRLTYEYIENCSLEDYDKLVDKYGLEKILKVRNSKK